MHTHVHTHCQEMVVTLPREYNQLMRGTLQTHETHKSFLFNYVRLMLEQYTKPL